MVKNFSLTYSTFGLLLILIFYINLVILLSGVRTPSNVRDIAKRKLFFESNSSTTGNLKSFSCNSGKKSHYEKKCLIVLIILNTKSSYISAGSTDQTPPIIITETGNISHGNVNSLDILGDDSLDALFNTPNLDSPILNNPILNSPISIGKCNSVGFVLFMLD